MTTMTQDLIDTLPEAPSPDLSDKYAFIDTRRVVGDMRDLGFEVANFRRPKFRTRAGAFGLHEVDFRRPEHLKASTAESPRILFMNTYDGSRRAHFMAGIIRWACSNGLVVGDVFQQDKFLHLGDYEEQLLEQIRSSGEMAGKVFDRIDKFKTITLDPKDYVDLATQASDLRFQQEAGLAVEPKHLLMPRRREDVKKDLWTTWNVLQENLLQGGIPGVDTSGKVRVTRTLSQIQKSNDLNRGLWNLLETFAEKA